MSETEIFITLKDEYLNPKLVDPARMVRRVYLVRTGTYDNVLNQWDSDPRYREATPAEVLLAEAYGQLRVFV